MPYKAGPGGQRSPAGTANPGGGAPGGGSGAGGGFGIGGFKATGPAPRGSSGAPGLAKSERLIGGKRTTTGVKAPRNVFQIASEGGYLTDDELAQLSPEQAAAYQAQRAALLFA